MYGTVARLRVKPDSKAKFLEVGRTQMAANISGHVATYVYQMDSDSNEFYLAVVFTSKEAYLANASSPEQNTRFEELMAVLDGPPEWHDGEVVSNS
jgi:quinol monooxygenase YgiN